MKRFKIYSTLTSSDNNFVKLTGEADYQTANEALGDALRMANDSGYQIHRLSLREVEPTPAGFRFTSPRRTIPPVTQIPVEAQPVWPAKRHKGSSFPS